MSFAFIILGIGVPLWWHTTSVLRVPLPYSGIADLSNLETKFQTKIVIAATSLTYAETLMNEIINSLEKPTLLRLDISHKIVSKDVVNSAFTLYDHEKIAEKFDVQIGQLLFLESPNFNQIFIGLKRNIFFPSKTKGSELTHILSQIILRDKSLLLTQNALTEPTIYRLDEENRRRFPPSVNYDVLVTIINPDPDRLKIKWNLLTLTEDYIEPFLNQLSMVANFSIKSQWLYLLPFAITPKQIIDSSPLRRHYAFVEDILPQLITPLEKKLASQVSLHPCINLVMYAVPCSESPIYIYTKTGHKSKSLNNIEAFMSPRWGGVVISNPPLDVCNQTIIEDSYDSVVEVEPNPLLIMGTFLSQLRLLLGIPEPDDEIPNISIVALGETLIRDWELDALLRVKAVEQLTSAKLTLQSLAQLLEEISNIVITETVGNRIKKALELIKLSAQKLNNGELVDGFLLSKEAFITSEAAFSDPSLLALLYFPEDQKYAVYIPLFLPIMIPVLFSIKNIKQYYFPNKPN
ncbi:GPI transamidase component PIG-S [Chelonus insularis]|uniref:GPI transamidase component PIG-S n=1 Tax=Chelonus insularis TaxID=460826 RepID=UPI00158A7071|nr:GPI transamidase component PIG-S [Chelonus insularis]XP_034938159.1 GPI transamidase component PIG-S [Chelonus insularis]